jgi:hypothetical protein
VKPVRLFTMAWGSPYIDWFEQACGRSLCWPKNREALQAVEAWDLWTTPEDAPRVEAIGKTLGIPVAMHVVLNANTMKANLGTALVGQIQICHLREAAMLFAAPDSIFGDGSIATLLNMGSAPRVCIAAAPMRVNVDILKDLGEPKENAALVKLGFKHMHRIFREAKVGERTNSLSTGISWRELSKDLYAIQYRAYSSYYMTPEQKDVDWYRKNPKLGYWDSKFPETLVPDQRQRVIASSDAVFICELTPESRPLPPVVKADAEPDKYEHNLSHHAINRNIVSIWRAA